MVNFEKLCVYIIDNNGHITEEHIKECGFGPENLERIHNGNISPERLVKNAIRCLKERGITVKKDGEIL